MLHACYATRGAIRAVPAGEACKAGEKPLTLEAPGDPLKQDAPVAFAARSARAKPVGSRLTRLVSGVVPAGAYHVSGAVRIRHPGGVSEDARISCALVRPGGKVIAASTVSVVFLKGQDAGEATLPVSATVDRMPGGRSSLACKEVALGATSARARAGGTPGSPGVLSGNLVQTPVHLPVNACGNAVGDAGLLNPATGNTCRNG